MEHINHNPEKTSVHYKINIVSHIAKLPFTYSAIVRIFWKLCAAAPDRDAASAQDRAVAYKSFAAFSYSFAKRGPRKDAKLLKMLKLGFADFLDVSYPLDPSIFH